jgi:hypothetical protein
LEDYKAIFFLEPKDISAFITIENEATDDLFIEYLVILKEPKVRAPRIHRHLRTYLEEE